MKKDRKLFGTVLRAAGLPQDVDPHRFFLQWTGGAECRIEQHRGILGFGKDRIRFLTEQGTLSVEGDDLMLVQLTEARAVVRGLIRSVSLEGKS